jgi:branched-chain amino acid transport system substrate-binding protein
MTAFARLVALAGVVMLCALRALPAAAQTIRIGVINTNTGPNGTLGEYIDKGMKLYMKLNASKLPPGIRLELLARDDGGANPDKARQLAQELIVREKIHLLTGLIWTPNVMAIAPLAQEAKVPMLVMNAGGSAVTTRSPYIARFSFTLWQSCYPLGQWAATHYKTAYIAVSDLAPGHDSEAAFDKGFTDAGGRIVGRVRIPLANPDYVPFLQRIKDSKPDVLFAFVPSARASSQIMKAYRDLGLDKAGIRFIGPGDLTSDEELPGMGDTPLGMITMHHYSAAADRPANRAFVAEWRKEYGEQSVPNFQSVAAWDTMDAIYHVVREQKGVLDLDRTMELLKHYTNPHSPRGPISIDPDTRDIVQNEYLREVRKMGGRLANVELETIPNVRDPWKELNKSR